MLWSLWKWLNELLNIINGLWKYGCTTFWYGWKISVASLWVGCFRKSLRKFPCCKLCFTQCESEVIQWNSHTLHKLSKDRQLSSLAPSNEPENVFFCENFLILSEETPYMVYSYVTRIVSWILKYRVSDKIEDSLFCWFSCSILITNNSSFNVNAGCSYNVRSSFQVKVPALLNTIHCQFFQCDKALTGCEDSANVHFVPFRRCLSTLEWGRFFLTPLERSSRWFSQSQSPICSTSVRISLVADGRKVFDGKEVRWISSIYFYRRSDAYFII